MARAWKLLVLLAVMLMPLGMAPAAAAPLGHSAMAGMPIGHCPDQGSNRDVKGGVAVCTMACAGALPAADLANREPMLIICEPVQPEAASTLHGLHPETATPPPRPS